MPQQPPPPPPPHPGPEGPPPAGGASGPAASRVPPPQSPVATPAAADQSPGKGSGGVGWKIATAVLAVTTVLALVWGVVSTNSLQSQVDDLEAQVAGLQNTVTTQEKSAQDAASVSSAQIASLEQQVQVLSQSLDALKESSLDALAKGTTAYADLEAQLEKSQAAVAKLKKIQADAGTSAEELVAEYASVQNELAQTQDALLAVLKEVAKESVKEE